MIVNSIRNPYYNYSRNYVQNKPNFQGRQLLKPNINITKPTLFKTGVVFLAASFLSKALDIEDFSIMQTLADLSLISFLCITEKKNCLSPELEFKKATTIEEAKNYAKNFLGIKKFDIEDLDYANWINEGLTNISNKFKGEVYFPRGIKKTKKKNALGAYFSPLDFISINKKEIDDCANSFEKLIKTFPYEQLTKYNFGPKHGEYCKKMKQAYENIDSLSVFEKCSLRSTFLSMREVYNQLSLEERAELEGGKKFNEDKYGNVYIDVFDTIYHEVGHCFAYKSNTYFKNFIDDKKSKNKELIKSLKVPNYTKSRPREFVACIFAGMMSGDKYPENIQNAFGKLTNFKVPQN